MMNDCYIKNTIDNCKEIKDKINVWKAEKILQESYKYMITEVYTIDDSEKCQTVREESEKEAKNLDTIIQNITNLIEKYEFLQESLNKDNNYVNQVDLGKLIEEISADQDKIYDLIKQNNDIHKNENVESNKEITEDVKDFDEYSSNKLIILENKIYLPYTSSEIKEYIDNGSYKTANEVIKKVFTLHTKKYQMPRISRMIEAYKLMRIKEKASISDSFRFALEIMNEKKLHPAIVTACKSQDELDTYLGCLEENKLEYFTRFKVEFKIKPLKNAFSH